MSLVRGVVALALVVSLAAHGQAPALEPRSLLPPPATLGQRIAYSLLGGAALGALFGGVTLYVVCQNGCRSPAVAGIGTTLAWSTGVALGVFAGEKLGADEVDILPALFGTTLGLLFAGAIALLGQNDRERVILAIPATLILPLAFATTAMEYARPAAAGDDSLKAR